MTLRFRRGLEADRTTITPAEGELLYTTNKKRLFVGDGTTAGGVGVLNPIGPDVGDMPRFERTQVSAAYDLNTALRLTKRVSGVTTFVNNLGGPAINFQAQVGDAGTLSADRSIGLFGARYQGSNTAYNHDFRFQLVVGDGATATYDEVLTLSRLRASFDVPIKPETFADAAARNTHYASFTDPDANPLEGDITFVSDDGNSNPRLQLYINNEWNSLLTRRVAHSDAQFSPTFVRETTSAGAGTVAMRVIKRKTDDTTTGLDRVGGAAIRFEYAYGAYNPNPATVTAGSFVVGQGYRISSLGSTTQAQWNTTAGTSGLTYGVGSTFIARNTGTGSGQATVSTEIQTVLVGSTYRGTTGIHEFSVYSTPDNGNTFNTHFVSSEDRFELYAPLKLQQFSTTARDTDLTTALGTLDVGMMIYNTTDSRVQVCTVASATPTWLSL